MWSLMILHTKSRMTPQCPLWVQKQTFRSAFAVQSSCPLRARNGHPQLYSITSLACASSVGGTAITRALAVLRLSGPNRVERERTAHCAPTSASKPSMKPSSAHASSNASARRIGERLPLLSSRRVNRNNFGSHPPQGQAHDNQRQLRRAAAVEYERKAWAPPKIAVDVSSSTK